MRIPPHWTESEAREARNLYRRWFALNPKTKNPTDVNTEAKYEFAKAIGWRRFKLMQSARKTNVATYDYPIEWTKPAYWEDNKRGRN